jgi:DNA polymerase III subunit delta'
MNQLLLHPHTKRQLAMLAAHMPQALLVSGPQGLGKTFAVIQWLQQELQARPSQIRLIQPEEKSGITVAQIRDLYKATRNKQTEPSYFVLRHAETMSIGAQNAFLKLLEEPGGQIFFILTATSLDMMLPTIQSRTQHVQLFPVANETLKAALQTTSLTPTQLQQVLFVASGRPAVAMQLARDSEGLSDQQALATLAKQIVTGSSFERLVVVSTVGADRKKAVALLEFVALMAQRLLPASSTPDQRRLVRQLEIVHETLERLSANANVKIQLTRFALTA